MHLNLGPPGQRQREPTSTWPNWKLNRTRSAMTRWSATSRSRSA